jgi:iron complex outermembrane recepter protein
VGDAADRDSQPQQAAPPRPNVIDEIIVTATKQERVLREIPGSIAVIDGAQLDQAAAQEMGDFLKFAPGASLISQDVGATKITIRGISSELGTAPTTGILYGNVSFADAYFPFVSLDPHPFDMQGVEVLKGPQGTLFGAAALNGAVRYVPQAPEFDRLSTKYFVQYRQLRQGDGVPLAGAALNLPFGGTLPAALRLVAVARRLPGTIDDTGRGLDDVNTGEQLAGRALFAWEPLEALRLSASYVRQDTHYDDEGFADNRDGRLERSNTPDANPRDSFYDFATLGLEYSFSWAALVAESAFVRKRFNQDTDISRAFTGANTSETSVDTFIFFDSDTLSQELRLVSRDAVTDPWSFVAGLFWMDQPIRSGFDIFVADSLPAGLLTTPLAGVLVPGLSGSALSDNGQPLLGRQRSDVSVNELAAFGEVSLRFGLAWELGLGMRAYRTVSGGIAVAEGALYGGAPNVNQDEIREQGLNPKLSLSWRPDERLMVYGLVSRGFRVGGIQPTASSLSQDVPSVFKSDTIWNYEAGLRMSWLERSLLTDLSVYHATWDDALLTQLDENNPNPVAYYYDNVAGAKSSGLEASLQWRTPVPGLALNLSWAWNRTVTTQTFNVSSGEAIAPGTSWPFAPRLQALAQLGYQRPLAGGWDLRAALTHSRTSKAYTKLLNDNSVYDYALTDIQLGLVDASERWPAVTLAVNNLLDRRGINQDTVLGEADPVHDVVYTAPRTVSLMFSGRF